jgi:hypothetical protein
VLDGNKHRKATEEWLNNLTVFSNAVSVTLHYNDTLLDKTFNTKQRLQKANKRLFRNLERHIFTRHKDRLHRIIVNETKLTSRNHLHTLIQIPEHETYYSFVAKLWLASSKTNEILENTLHTTHIYNAINLINYLTKESNYTIDNIDVLNSRY